MAGKEETAPAKEGSTTADEASKSPTVPFAWADGLMDVLAKYDARAERQLYVDFISVSRCIRCRERLKTGAKTCSCKQPVSTKSKACTRCAGGKPWLWCYECEAYFCEPCHLKPHVLMLGGTVAQKHHCYPTDGATGSLMHRGAWSPALLSMAKTARRHQMKLTQDTAPVKNTNGATTSRDPRRQASRPPVVPSAARQPTPPPASTSNRHPTPPPTPSAVGAGGVSQGQVPGVPMRSRSPSPTPTGRQQPPSSIQRTSISSIPAHSSQQRPTIKEEIGDSTQGSRKRKSPTADTVVASEPGQQGVPPRAPPLASQFSMSSAQPAGEADGMSLYERLRQMHSKRQTPSPTVRVKSEAPVPSHPVATTAHTPTSTPTATSMPTPALATPSELTPTLPTPRASTPIQQMEAAPVSHTLRTEAPHPTGAASTSPSSPQQMGAELEEALSQPIEPPPAPLVHLPTPSEQPPLANTQAAATNHSSGRSFFGDTPSAQQPSNAPEDPLKTAVVEEYDRSNAHVFRLESQLAQLNDAVRRASLQNVTYAAMISQRVGEYRKALSVAHEQRYRALAKVILFAPDMRAFAKSLQRHELGDVPGVLPSGHKNCQEFAQSIRDLREKLQSIRSTIDSAVSSGDVSKLMQLQTLGGEIKQIEDQIRQAKRDRDQQFRVMVQFSKPLRETVQMLAMSTRPEGQPR